MYRFSADYLHDSRRGLWETDRSALAPLDLDARERVLDVGCGRGSLGRAMAAESQATIVGVDADAEHAGPGGARALGDARRLPFADGSFDLVACQALLVNLSDPDRAIAEFARVSADLVAAVEPDNGAVAVDSTVAAEARLADRARGRVLGSHEANPALGPAVPALFRDAGLEGVRVSRREFSRVVEPPYAPRSVEAAGRKARGAGIASVRDRLIADGLDPEAVESLREEWRAMGRAAAAQMARGEYRREETVPLYVTVGTVPDA